MFAFLSNLSILKIYNKEFLKSKFFVPVSYFICLTLKTISSKSFKKLPLITQISYCLKNTI
nr:MAG TPA: hypothetical protein [Caudoviricetes sp.]